MRLVCIFFLFFLNSAQAAICPDPIHSSLRLGIIPEPWLISPFSDTSPIGVPDTIFIRANILIAGLIKGVACTYGNSAGYYSIWWQSNVKYPSCSENNWRRGLGGFECDTSLTTCWF